MKLNYTYFSICIFLFLANCKPNSNHTENASETPEISSYLKSISYIDSINGITNLDSIALNGEDYLEHVTDNGALLIGYYLEGNLVKISERLGLSLGFSNRDIYLKNGEIQVIYYSENIFPPLKDENGNISGLDYSNLETNFEQYAYIDQNQLKDTLIQGERQVTINIQDHQSELTKFKNIFATYKNNMAKYEILQGKWQSADDDLYINEFTNNEVKEIYDGEIMTEQTILLEGDRLIYSDDLYYSIVKLDADSMILIFPDRGNTLRFFKVK